MTKIMTIGVYGFTEEAFFDTLQTAGVDLLCDIRWRRGVRGARYAFANRKRLQTRLEALEIEYIHRRDLAPTPEIRRLQQEADKAARIAKRQRNTLDPTFVEAYGGEILAHFNPRAFIDNLPEGKETVALLCVERDPAACHRSLVAEQLQYMGGVETVHHLVSRS